MNLKVEVKGINRPELGDEFNNLTEPREKALKKKLVDLVNHHADLKAEKKAMSSALNEQITGAQKKIEAIGETFKKKDIGYLQGAFDPAELDFLK